MFLNFFKDKAVDITADKEIKQLIKRVIQDDLSRIVAEVVKAEMKPLQGIVEQVQGTQDVIVKQVNEDRKEISAILTKQTTIDRQQKTIIDNQNHIEDRIVDIVQSEVKKIPKNTELAVDKIFEKKPFLFRIRNKFGGGKK